MKYKNNPFNIRKGSAWFGLIGQKNGFCEFSDLVFGVRACMYLLRKTYPHKYYSFTVEDCIRRFAPESDHNDTNAYISFVCDGADFVPATEVCGLRKSNFFYLLKRMALMESNTVLSDDILELALSKLKNPYYEQEK